MLYLLLNLDISSLTVGILRSRYIVSLVTLKILEFLIGIVEEFLCCNYSLFPMVGSHRFHLVLTLKLPTDKTKLFLEKPVKITLRIRYFLTKRIPSYVVHFWYY